MNPFKIGDKIVAILDNSVLCNIEDKIYEVIGVDNEFVEININKSVPQPRTWFYERFILANDITKFELIMRGIKDEI